MSNYYAMMLKNKVFAIKIYNKWSIHYEKCGRCKKVYRLLEDFFQPEKYDDMAANGLLADNTAYFEKIYTATFSSKEVLQKLKENKHIIACFLPTTLEHSMRKQNRQFIFHRKRKSS